MGLDIFCDESGGVGRGVMTLAAIAIDDGDAEAVLARYRAITGLDGELKGSRIDFGERGLVFELLGTKRFTAAVTIAISATNGHPGEDRGVHDMHVYAALLNRAIGHLLPPTGDAHILFDDGRYAPSVMVDLHRELALLLGTRARVALELSHARAGLQLADVIANTFFTRAIVSDRQARMAAIVQPLLDSGQIVMDVIPRETERENA